MGVSNVASEACMCVSGHTAVLGIASNEPACGQLCLCVVLSHTDSGLGLLLFEPLDNGTNDVVPVGGLDLSCLGSILFFCLEPRHHKAT